MTRDEIEREIVKVEVQLQYLRSRLKQYDVPECGSWLQVNDGSFRTTQYGKFIEATDGGYWKIMNIAGQKKCYKPEFCAVIRGAGDTRGGGYVVHWNHGLRPGNLVKLEPHEKAPSGSVCIPQEAIEHIVKLEQGTLT